MKFYFDMIEVRDVEREGDKKGEQQGRAVEWKRLNLKRKVKNGEQ